MSDCKKKDNWRKRLCATLWFEVKSAPFPSMAEPPSGNKKMCLWAGFPIERWWVCCIRMPSMETWADFRAAVNHNITVLVWSEYENVYEINHLGGIKYNISG